jgi:hypothetical protein
VQPCTPVVSYFVMSIDLHVYCWLYYYIYYACGIHPRAADLFMKHNGLVRSGCPRSFSIFMALAQAFLETLRASEVIIPPNICLSTAQCKPNGAVAAYATYQVPPIISDSIITYEHMNVTCLPCLKSGKNDERRLGRSWSLGTSPQVTTQVKDLMNWTIDQKGSMRLCR